MSKPLNTDNWVAFIQPDGAGTVPKLMSGVSITALSIPGRGITPNYIKSFLSRDKYIISSVNREAPALPTFTIETIMKAAPSYLNDNGQCDDLNLFLAATDSCTSPLVLDFDQADGYIICLRKSTLTNSTPGGLPNRNTSEESMWTFELSMTVLSPTEVFTPIDIIDISTLETNRANSLTAVPKNCCTAQKIKPLEIYYITCQAGTGVTANVLVKYKDIASPVALATDPFGTDQHITASAITPVSGSKYRLSVFGGDVGVTGAGPANPVTVNYADFDMATPTVFSGWTSQVIGSVNAEFFTGGNSVASFGKTIVAVTDAGKMHKSTDGSVTWSDINSPTSTRLNVVKFAYDQDSANNGDQIILFGGNSNTLYLSKNGGETQPAAVTADSSKSASHIISAALLNAKDIWVGYSDDGKIYTTKNGGLTWSNQTLPAPATGGTVNRVNHIHRENCLDAWAAGMWTDGSSDEFGVVWRTFDGGYSWKVFKRADTFTAASPIGFTGLATYGINDAVTAGDIDTTTAIMALQGPSAQ